MAGVYAGAMVLETQECMRFEPENLFIILGSFFENIICSPGPFFVVMKNCEGIFLDIIVDKIIFHKNIIFLSLQNQGKFYNPHMKQFYIRMPDWKRIDWTSPINLISVLSVLGALLYAFNREIIIY